MPVTRAPKRPEEEPSRSDEARIKEIIGRGGSVAGEQLEEEQDEQKSLQLRLYQSMIAEIDALRMSVKRGKKPSRHSWIVQAIEEKLKREQAKQR